MNTEAHLENLVARYVDGTCGPMELAELETLLLEDAGNRKYFIDIVLLAEDLSMLDGPSQQRIGVGFLPFEVLRQRQQTRTVKNAVLAAAAVILISAVATWTQMAPRNESAMASFWVAPDWSRADFPAHGGRAMFLSEAELSLAFTVSRWVSPEF